MTYMPIVATLAYVMSPDRQRVLLVHRTKRQHDQHLGKYNGLGGKLDPGEDVVAGMKRELLEEAGIVPVSFLLRGTVNWPGFGPDGEDWFGFVFRVDTFEGEPLAENDEGSLEWIAVDRVIDLPLWEGDRHFLPLVFADDPPQFHGVMPYHDGRPVSWTYHPV